MYELVDRKMPERSEILYNVHDNLDITTLSFTSLHKWYTISRVKYGIVSFI